MANEDVIRCTLCGTVVPPGVMKCPNCSTEVKGAPKRKPAGDAEVAPQTDDYLHKDLPKAQQLQAKVMCPLCALEIGGGETKCPRCGIPLSVQDQMLECPECGSLSPFGTVSCPHCGVTLPKRPEGPPQRPPAKAPEVEEPQPVPVVVPQEEKVAPPPLEAVTTVAAKPPASTQGLVNGRGAINGTGLVNGTGMVNGMGKINGTKGEGRAPSAATRRRSLITRWQFIAVLVALVIVIPTFVYLSYSTEKAAIVIDGDFDDWSDVQMFSVSDSATVDSVNVTCWAVHLDGSRLYLYACVLGEMMATQYVDSFYLFIDSDGSSSTGYRLSGIGADYLIEVDGWNGSVQSSSVDQYRNPNYQLDWNSWESIGSASTAVSGSELEAMVDLGFTMSPDSRLLLVSQDQLERTSVSYPVMTEQSLLLIEQFPGADISRDGIVPSASSVEFLRLRLLSQGSGGTVTSITPTVVGALSSPYAQEIELEPGVPEYISLYVGTSLASPGELVSAFVSSGFVDSTFSEVFIMGSPARAYVASQPSSIVIDGAFGDWIGRTSPDSDSDILDNPDIDIDEVGAVNDSLTSAFYVSVHGEICSGSYVPVLKSVPSDGGGGGDGVVIPVKTGEDRLRIYIDSDMSSTTGYLVTLSAKEIGADYMIEVKGIDGEIMSRAIYRYLYGQWVAAAGSVNAAKDTQRIELSISSASISGSSSIDFIVETTDWLPRSDFATAVPSGARSIDGGLTAASIFERWIVDGSTASASATAMSYQRKLFFDGVNYWSFYKNTTETVYRYSSDYGVTWSTVGSAFTTRYVNETSIWYDSARKTVYAVGDRLSASNVVYVRKGVVSPTAHSISWSSENTVTVSSNPLGGKNAFISKDSNQYLWVISSNCTQSSPTAAYDLSVFRSTSANSTTSWVYMANMIDGTDSDADNVKGSIVPIGTGSNMWAVYTYKGNVASKKYVPGGWTYYNILTASGTSFANTESAPPSAVVDGDGVIHIVYGDCNEKPTGNGKPRIYYANSTGSDWTPLASRPRLDTVVSPQGGNIDPTISLDSSTNGIFAFWIETDTNMVGQYVEGKKKTSSGWTDLVFAAQDQTVSKKHLTSIYSVPGEQYICWQWTQNITSTPTEVIFDKIPEFSDMSIPVFAMLVVFLVVLRRTRSGKK